MYGRRRNPAHRNGLFQDLGSITACSGQGRVISSRHLRKTTSHTTRRIRLMPVILLLGLMHSSAFANVLYVNAAASGGDGSRWGNAYNDLQTALTAAADNDQVWVAAGTYKPTSAYDLILSGNRDYHFRMKNGVAIYGGFPNTGSPGWHDRDPNTHETILSGDIGTAGSNGDNCYHVFFHPWTAEINTTAALDGFTITGGNANDTEWPHNTGGGMYNEYCNPTISNCTFTGNTALYGGGMNNEYCNPTVTNCTFSDNSASYYGGGMENYYSNPLVLDCAFSQNSANTGGGMDNVSSSPFVMGCTFDENDAADDPNSGGGGMSNFLEEGSGVKSSPTVTDCVFSGNSAVYGGGIVNEYRDPQVTDCTFSNNTADDGGAMYNYSSMPSVTECTFTGNTALYGGGISNEDSNSLVTNCLFSGNAADYGGAIENFFGSPSITNCSIAGNTAFYGGGISNEDSNSVLVNNILWGNIASTDANQIYNDNCTPTIAYSSIQGGLPGGSIDGGGSIDADPMFVRMPDDGGDGWGDSNDDFGDLQLQGGSPCIDAGDTTAVPAGVTTDLDGEPRFVEDPTVDNTGNGTAPIVDMGAYESDDPCLGRDAADFDCNGIVNLADFVMFASRWLQ